MILLINTANYISFVGLAENYKIVKQKIWEANLRQSEELLPVISKMIGDKKIDGIIVVTGPGSYTGLRVGVATANALAYGWNCKVVGVDRFESLRNGKWEMGDENRKQEIENRNSVIILENINDLIYGELKIENRELRIVATIDDLCEKIAEPCYFIGQINSEKEKIIKEKLKNKVLEIIQKDDFDKDVLNNLLKIGEERLKNAKQENIAMPYYLREPHITKPKKAV